MGEIERFDVNETWAHAGIVKAGDFYFLSYCVGNIRRENPFKRILHIPVEKMSCSFK